MTNKIVKRLKHLPKAASAGTIWRQKQPSWHHAINPREKGYYISGWDMTCVQHVIFSRHSQLTEWKSSHSWLDFKTKILWQFQAAPDPMNIWLCCRSSSFSCSQPPQLPIFPFAFSHTSISLCLSVPERSSDTSDIHFQSYLTKRHPTMYLFLSPFIYMFAYKYIILHL